MERVWALSFCFGVAGLWAGGLGQHWWRHYRITPAAAAFWSLLIGISQWVPSFQDVALGTGLIAAAMFEFHRRAGIPRLLRSMGMAVMALFVLSWFPTRGMRINVEATVFALGIFGSILASDPVEALTCAASGILMADIAGRIVWPTQDSLNRTAAAVLIVSALLAWGARWTAGQFVAAKRLISRQQK